MAADMVNQRMLAGRGIETLAASLAQVAGNAKDTVVIINADAQASHQSVINVMDAARRVGLTQLTFATQGQHDGAASWPLTPMVPAPGAFCPMSRLAEHLNRAWLHRGLLGLHAVADLLADVGAGAAAPIRIPAGLVAVRAPAGAGAGGGQPHRRRCRQNPHHLGHLAAPPSAWPAPGVLTRGYKASQNAPPHRLLDASTEASLSAAETGDEPLLIWRRTHAPMAIGRDRAQGGRALLAAHPELDILVCDDGLQHLKLQRDIEVIVFDERGQGNGWLLPAGPLREPIDSIETPGLKAPPLVLLQRRTRQHLPAPASSPSAAWPRWSAWRNGGERPKRVAPPFPAHHSPATPCWPWPASRSPSGSSTHCKSSATPCKALRWPTTPTSRNCHGTMPPWT